MQGKKINFKKARTPLRKKLMGEYVILEPINLTKHATQLYKNFSADKKNIIWNYLPYGPFKNIKDFKTWLVKNCLTKDPFFYAIYSKRHRQYCGMTSYLRITPDHGSIEVGHINYSPLLQNTVEGTETMYLMMKNAFEEFGISFDHYSRTSSKQHHKNAKEFFTNLMDKRALVAKETQQYFDPEAGQFLADRYITGECPKCHAADA